MKKAALVLVLAFGALALLSGAATLMLLNPIGQLSSGGFWSVFGTVFSVIGLTGSAICAAICAVHLTERRSDEA